MLCRRCGMESATDDVCEWCKRPMLPEGAAVSARAAAQAKADPEAAQPQPQQPADEAPPPAEGQDLASPAAEPSPQPVASASAEKAGEDILRPLGDVGGKAQSRPGAVTHGLGEQATRTSVDVANYLPPDQTLFRPAYQTERTHVPGGAFDPLAQRRRAKERKAVSSIPDNIRLTRSLAVGLFICLTAALTQFFVTHNVPTKLYFLGLGEGDQLKTAIFWGLGTGVLLGFGLGALLVQFKRGPFLGLLFGLMLGFVGLQNGYWSGATGALCGAIIGRIATVGYRRAITV